MTYQALDLKAQAIVLRYAQRRRLDAAGLNDYLRPKIDPHRWTLPDADKAEARLRHAIATNERIAIFGDYDADGITSVSILLRFFYECTTLRPSWKLPDRRNDQYGLDLTMAAKLVAEFQPQLLFCLDNGTNSVETIAWLRGLGVEVIVVDHHPMVSRAAEAVALVNPAAYPDRPSGDLTNLCAAGLTLFLCAYLAEAWGCRDRWDNVTATMLAGIGTLADAVRLSPTNRAIIKNSLSLLNSQTALERCAGLKALVPADGQRISQRRVQFEIAPPLNALGRLESPTPGVELLTSDDPVKAQNIAAHCRALNERRKVLQKQIVEQALSQGQEQLRRHPALPVLVLADASWLPGVVGPAASRVAEQLGRSAILVGIDSAPNRWKGSGRAHNSDHLGAWLEAVKALGMVERGGGHAAAVGVALRSEQIDQLRGIAPHIVMPQTSHHEAESEVVGDDNELSPAEWLQVFDLLEPFGPGNPAPLLHFGNAKLVSAPTELLLRETGKPWALKGAFQVDDRSLSVVWTDVDRGRSIWHPGARYDLELELTARPYQGRMYFNWSVSNCAQRPPSGMEKR